MAGLSASVYKSQQTYRDFGDDSDDPIGWLVSIPARQIKELDIDLLYDLKAETIYEVVYSDTTWSAVEDKDEAQRWKDIGRRVQ